ncbi:MlaD family protein [Neolewinella antarctica]|uniref:Phospholipid/cholesterol/gamma-HCH transport system substrate-binding protein n=1 Tax=Neolewinella antarctica TaxID=442734 RepID=A0ABX0X6L7_9BACT|nr:MlaD family protein [Neolewinella antarctica]NJC24848.1 phospholipid/cholesterol/gamma-HCH transport system substrate-binding protein [Neolewinella antarctica]
MKYEVKIGILAIVAIGMAIWGFKYIQGSNLFSSSNEYFVLYEDVAGLTIGTPVQISGVNVGSVSNIKLDQQTKLVQVTMDVRDDINIPTTTTAYIVSVSMLGEKAIDLTYQQPCFGEDDCAPSGTTIQGATKSILAGLLGTEEGDDPLGDMKGQFGTIVDSLQYTLFSPESDNPIARSMHDLAITMENLRGTSTQLRRVIDNNTGEINQSMRNIASLTETLASKQEALGGIIDNASGFASKINQLEVEQTVTEINEAVSELKSTVTKANGAIDEVSGILADVGNGKGTLGKLLNDDGVVYDRLESATMEADTLLSDFQERPYRYIPFKSRKRVLKHDRKDQALQSVGPKQ